MERREVLKVRPGCAGAMTTFRMDPIEAAVYYRLTEPERPVIHEDVRHWRSVWVGS